jgi:putative membrane protein
VSEAVVTWETIHPAINAALNATSAVFLVLGFLAIRRKDIARHRAMMLAAFSASTVFLVSYLIRFAISGTHRYPGEGWDKTLYLVVLFSHMILAVVLVPMALRALFLGWKNRVADHRRLAKWTWPIWMYTSVTGVVVYLMLYHLAPVLHP